MSNQNISDLCCKTGFDKFKLLVYNLTTRWRLSWVVSYVEWQALNEVNDLEFWKKNPEIQSLLALNKSFETLNKTSHRCRLSLNFKIFFITARCLITQEYFYIKKGFENSVFLFGKNYEKYWKISKMTKTPATVYFQNWEFSVI